MRTTVNAAPTLATAHAVSPRRNTRCSTVIAADVGTDSGAASGRSATSSWNVMAPSSRSERTSSTVKNGLPPVASSTTSTRRVDGSAPDERADQRCEIGAVHDIDVDDRRRARRPQPVDGAGDVGAELGHPRADRRRQQDARSAPGGGPGT